MGNDMRSVCRELSRKQYMQSGKFFITLFLRSPDRYYFNVLIIIKLLYHMYIENEIYHMAYKKVQYCLNEYQLMGVNKSKWDDYIICS